MLIVASVVCADVSFHWMLSISCFWHHPPGLSLRILNHFILSGQLIAEWFTILSFDFSNFSLLCTVMLLVLWSCCFSSCTIRSTNLRERFSPTSYCCCYSSSYVVVILALFFLQRKCYGFERGFFDLRHFLPYTPFWRVAQSAFVKVTLRARSSTSKVLGKSCWVSNIVLAQPFICITQLLVAIWDMRSHMRYEKPYENQSFKLLPQIRRLSTIIGTDLA